MAKISKTTAKERIEFLKRELEKHNYNYYVLNAPTITDFEFDLLMGELQGLEKRFPEFATEDSPSRHVGSDLTSGAAGSDFVQVAHRWPMLSLGNTYAREELLEFGERIRKTVSTPCHFSCELKFDGTAICLTYRDGRLLRALTRGDGTKGDDEPSKGHMIIATVKGDVHDIGKNIVKVVVQSHGFTVTDLGKDVPKETVLEATIKEQPDAVGLSALMTTTVDSMKETIEYLRANGITCPIIVGGAVMTPDIASAIGATYYSKDALETAHLMQDICGAK